jgi:ComF family protein
LIHANNGEHARLSELQMPSFSINTLLDVFLPRQCLLCRLQTGRASNICHLCQSRLPRIVNPCAHCGIDMQTISTSMLCARCITKPVTAHRCIGLYRYEDGARKLITEFKFKAKFAAGKFLAEELAKLINAHYRGTEAPDGLLAIPLHRARLAQRGYNQSLLLAQRIAHLTGIPLLTQKLSKRHATPAQSSLNSAAERAQNLRNAFAVHSDWDTQHLNCVILIDDVVTTQATFNEAATTLHRGGVKIINCFCVARANLN